jgi:hypothetical protein
MKGMLIAAVSVGAVIAGLILYARKAKTGGTKLLSGSDGTSNRHISIHPQNAMG